MSCLLRDRPASTLEMLTAFGDEALLRAALAFEAMLARAQAEAGLIPALAAETIAAACAELPDVGTLAEAAAHAGTLAIPLVTLIRERIADPEIAKLVHKGATSQDLADTAVGAAGAEADCGVTEFEAAEAVPNPFELRARTLNV